MKNAGPVRELSIDERALYVDCPVCKAKRGEKCDSRVGLVLGSAFHGGLPSDGTHMARLAAAPTHVQEVPVDVPERIPT